LGDTGVCGQVQGDQGVSTYRVNMKIPVTKCVLPYVVKAEEQARKVGDPSTRHAMVWSRMKTS
jgi:hypothetical protein